jgi:hypothetical protein
MQQALLRLALPLCLAVIAGCGDLPAEYGRSHGKSVNGCQAFHDLLVARGHSVKRVRKLTAQTTGDCDVLILFNKDLVFADDASDFLGTWLTLGDNRQLLYVGRDFDASVLVWRDVQAGTAGLPDRRQHERAQKLYQQAYEELEALGAVDVAGYRFPFGGHDERDPPALFPPIRDDSQLAEGTTGSARLYLRHYPVASEFDTVEMHLGGDPLVVARPFQQGQVTVVANGSFLLNYSLLNHDHRVMAVTLADQLGSDRRIGFVEHARVGRGSDDGFDLGSTTLYNPFAFLKHRRILWTLLHWVAVGIIFVVFCSPVFGRPRVPVVVQREQFANHIRAYALMLRRTGDRAYASELLERLQR